MVDVDVQSGLDYPRRGDGALALHAVAGGLPAVLSVLVGLLWIVALVVPEAALAYLLVVPLSAAVGVFWVGYFVSVVRGTLAGELTPPGLGNWGQLARDGLWGCLIGAVYTVPGIAMTAAVYAVMFASVFGMEFVAETARGAGLAVGLLGIVAMLVGSVVLMGYGLVVAYLLPASLVVYGATDSVRAALSPGRLSPLALSTEYAVPWLLVAGVTFAVYNAVAALTMVLVGYLLAPLLPVAYFYLSVAGVHLFAQAYALETDGGAVDQTVEGPPARTTGAGGTSPSAAADRGPEDV